MTRKESADSEGELRERLPDEVYAAHADYVRLAMKRMTARRMVGWLREYAEYARVSGADKTASHAEHVADGLAGELPEESVLCARERCRDPSHPHTDYCSRECDKADRRESQNGGFGGQGGDNGM